MPQVTPSELVNAPTLPAPGLAGGREHSIVGVVAVPTTWIDGTDDLILLPPLPSGAVLQEFSLANDDLDSGAGLVVDVGLTDQFGRDLDPTGADSREGIVNVEPWSITNALADKRFSVAGTSTRDRALWQLINMTSDPAGPLFPCLRIQAAAATPAAGNVIYRMRYTVD